jgi:HAD superfamily hydrolase (TIGR01509 family)
LDRSLRSLQGPAGPTEVRGVLLDVDGTLVDSNDAHARAWVAAFAEAGYDVAWARIRRMIGMGGDKLVPLVTGLSELDPKARRIGERRAEIFAARELGAVGPLPGARELIERMSREGLRLAAASSASPDEVRPLLERTGVAYLVAAPLAGASDEPSKPDPNVVQAALRRVDLRPSEAVMVGDTPYDLEAARLANVASILFRTGGWPDVQLAGAVAIYDGPWDLLARFDDSLLKRRSPRSEASPVDHAPGA